MPLNRCTYLISSREKDIEMTSQLDFLTSSLRRSHLVMRRRTDPRLSTDMYTVSMQPRATNLASNPGLFHVPTNIPTGGSCCLRRAADRRRVRAERVKGSNSAAEEVGDYHLILTSNVSCGLQMCFTVGYRAPFELRYKQGDHTSPGS